MRERELVLKVFLDDLAFFVSALINCRLASFFTLCPPRSRFFHEPFHKVFTA